MMDPIRIAIGPENPDFGSWNWIGRSLVEGLRSPFLAETFRDPFNIPTADIIVFLKFKPSCRQLQSLRQQQSRLVYLPVDVYGSSAEIDGDCDSLRLFDLTVVHCTRLIRYFTGYGKVQFLDHPLRYVLPQVRRPVLDGPILWIGRRCNITPIVEWANQTRLPDELCILTNTEDGFDAPDALGFTAKNAVSVETWTETRHIEWLKIAKLAIDIKGSDFRSRHKPPAKSLDFLASGVPVLTNYGSSPGMYVEQLGLRTLDIADWTTESLPSYAEDTISFGKYLQKTISKERVVERLSEILKTLYSDYF